MRTTPIASRVSRQALVLLTPLLVIGGCDSRESADVPLELEETKLFYPDSTLIGTETFDERLSGSAIGGGRYEAARVQSVLKASVGGEEILAWYREELEERGWSVDAATSSSVRFERGRREVIDVRLGRKKAFPDEWRGPGAIYLLIVYETPEECEGEVACAQ